MSDQGEQYEKSWTLYHILDRFVGCREMVALTRRMILLEEQLIRCKNMTNSTEVFYTGSRAEGMDLKWSDRDQMYINKNTIVTCPDNYIFGDQLDSSNKTILIMREANSRPGYVNLELLHLGDRSDKRLVRSIIPVGDVNFISSEIYKKAFAEVLRKVHQTNVDINGPAVTLRGTDSTETDMAISFHSYNWPSEADEWVRRPRWSGWPNKALRDKIVKDGCHLVPVGDKTSANPFLQWRISFTTAERKLIHTLSHVQFLVYALLKYFLKQISGMLKQMLGETDILSSYIIKTVMFHAVESTPASFWQEKHMFFCFMFCLKILVNWVKVGYCPNYFIKNNNMFLGKVHGENQRKLLFFLTDLYDMNWKCLSVGTHLQPTIGDFIDIAKQGRRNRVLPPPEQSEFERDFETIHTVFCFNISSDVLPLSLELLSASTLDTDECLGYFASVREISDTGMTSYSEHVTARGNKAKYTSLRKCKNLLKPFATVCTSPGLLRLATYYYQTGNYMKALDMCGHMISSSKLYLGCEPTIDDVGRFIDRHGDTYKRFCYGRGYTLLQKCQAYISDMMFTKENSQFCPSQLHPEITKLSDIDELHIPPLPYAVFMSFLCYHELGDTRRRDTALTHLRTVKNDLEQGISQHWVIHNLLGICYEMVGDKHRAFMEYKDSLSGGGCDQHTNPARERIQRLHLS